MCNIKKTKKYVESLPLPPFPPSFSGKNSDNHVLESLLHLH